MDRSTRVLIELAQGTIAGVSRESYRRFCGIAYAEQPVGELRWKPPVGLSPGHEDFDAARFGPMAPQASEDGSPPLETSEACLNLNVWTPPSTAKAPVMVWIHGGGFCQGSNRIRGSALAKEGVVLVAPNYRLGVLGFASHPLIDGSAANFGLLDLVHALRWVQENIVYFGGDPENVTIFGVSAGGAAVNLLMTMPSAEGLFHKAIAQSGYGTWPLLRVQRSVTDPLDILHQGSLSAEESTTAVFERAGLKNPDAERLMTISADRLVRGQRGFQLPIVDGIDLLEEPGICFEQRRVARIPYLTGANSFDGSVMPSYQLDPSDYRAALDRFNQDWRSLYADDLESSQQQGTQRIFGDERYLLSALLLAESISNAGGEAFLYYLDVLPSEMPDGIGSPHGFDAFLLFESAVINPASAEAELGRRLRDAWISFATLGHPKVISEDERDWRSLKNGGAWHRIGGGSRIKATDMHQRLKWLTQRHRLRVLPATR